MREEDILLGNKCSQEEMLNPTTTNILANIYNTIITQADIIAFELDKENRMVYANTLYDKYFGKRTWENINVSDRIFAGSFVHKEDIGEYMSLFDELGENEFKSVICRILCKDKHYRWFRITVCNFFDSRLGDFSRRIGMLQDVNNELSAFKQIKDYEEYDSLTGLYNEEKFEFEGRALISNNSENTYCVIALDINRFKAVNEIYDTKVGNKILKFVASVVKGNIPDKAICARMYADVFCVLMPYKSVENIIDVIRCIYEKIQDNPYDIILTTSFGVFLADTPANASLSVGAMRDRALMAKKTIKKEAVNYYAFFSDEFRDEIVMEQEIEHEMSKALEKGQFQVYLQPKVELSSEKLIGAEALVRWQHPKKGMIMPDSFVPVFEKNGFIINVDQYVCERVCMLIRKWLDEGFEPVPISVNLSRLHVYNERIIEFLECLMEKYRLTPDYLRFEITETVFLGNMEILTNVLKKLRDMGFKVEMDDFGTGYSSLSMLRNAPVDLIKIDKEFFDEKMNNDKGKVVVSHTIAMAKALELEVLAEGVETPEHVKFLKESNCDMAQGFLFSKPMSVEEFEEKFISGGTDV